jgi:hypothetical protein
LDGENADAMGTTIAEQTKRSAVSRHGSGTHDVCVTSRRSRPTQGPTLNHMRKHEQNDYDKRHAHQPQNDRHDKTPVFLRVH